jgi:RND family efflux transporter MFP subunit
MKKFVKIIVIIAAVLVSAGVILYQTGTFNSGLISPGETSGAKQEISGKVLELKPTQVPVVYKTVGTVRSRDEIELSPRIIARVKEITKRSGDSIKNGEVLVRLDSADLEAAVKRAEESLISSRATLDRATKEYNRQRLLLAKNVIPRKSFEQAEEAWQSARAGVEAARQSMKQAEANLSYATIRSPMNGVVSDRLDDPGDLASPGNIIMKVFDPERLMLYVPLRESRVKAVKVGDKIDFYVEALKKNFTGEVREIVPAVDPGSRTFLVKMCILGNAKGLMPGMFGTVSLKLGTEESYVVPDKAILRIGQLEYLMVLRDGKSLKVLIRSVPGIAPETRKVISGISTPEKIVVQ